MKTACHALFFIVSVLALSACGGGSDSVGVSNTAPGGSVGGVIIDAATMKPFAGVAVTVIAGAKQFPEAPAVTDANGRFAVENLPSGNLLIQLKPPASHLAVSLEQTLPSAAGEYPVGNAILSLGPIALLPLATDSAFRVQLVTADGAAPTQAVRAQLRTSAAWVDLSGGQFSGQGSAFVEAQSDGTGVVRFVGMPDIVKVAGMVGAGATSVSDTVKVIVPPFDSNKDNMLEFFGKEQNFQLLKLGNAVPTIVLSSGNAAVLQILASNIPALMGKSGNRVLASNTGSIFATFNYPLLDKLTEVTVYDERGTLLPSAAKRSISANLLTVTFDPALSEGNEYNVNIRAFANVEGVTVESNFGAPVFSPPKQGKVVVQSLTRTKALPNRVYVVFSEPIGLAIVNQPMTGAYAPLFFNDDLNGSGAIGDAPGERGYSSSTIGMTIDEVQPPGLAGKSWLSKYWFFDLPTESPSGTVVPAGASFDFGFAHIGAGPGGTVQRADTTSVGDILNQSVPAVP
jgi:hypothetical protein